MFEQLFQRSGRGRKTQSNDLPGEDQLYQLEIDFKDAALGGEREISLPSGKHLKVKIPGGIKSGTRLRFKAHGSPGRGRGAAGDAYVEITVRPLEGFKRVEQDIETEVNISFIEALLGGEIKVPTIEGSVMLKIPSGVSTGSRLRIRGKGVSDGKKRGDQIVALKVVMPKKPDPELVEAVQAWEEKFNYNPRTEVV